MPSPRLATAAVALLAFLLAFNTSCGGGGSAPEAPEPIQGAFDFGERSSTAPTVVTIDLENPAEGAATIRLAGVTGPFAVGPAQLPLAVDAGEVFSLDVAFAPGGVVGAASGELRLVADAGLETPLTVELSAEGEAVDATVLTSTVDFGEVLPGETREGVIEVRNNSLLSSAVVQVLVAAPFETVSASPVQIPPETTGEVAVRYAPTEGGVPSAIASVVTGDAGGPVNVSLTGTSAGTQVVDFGNQPFRTSAAVPGTHTAQTDLLTFVVPDDAVSFQVEAYADGDTYLALSQLTGPAGENFEDQSFAGFYLQYPDFEAFAAQVPNTDDAQQQVKAGEWSLRIGRPFAPGGAANDDPNVDVRVIIQRRPGPNTQVATLDLNIFLAQAIAPTAATASADADLQEVLDLTDALLSGQGVRLGKITYYDIADLTESPEIYDDVNQQEFGSLLALSGHPSVADERFNYFLVREALGNGVLGVSAKLGGTTRRGTRSSGVMGLYIDDPSASEKELVAHVTAHEMGHYLGLRHTVEQNGSHDLMGDTANCASGGCAPSTQKYLMHWSTGAGSGPLITNGQGAVIRGHGHMRGAHVTSSKPTLSSHQLRMRAASFLAPANWCATCARCHDKHELGLGR